MCTLRHQKLCSNSAQDVRRRRNPETSHNIVFLENIQLLYSIHGNKIFKCNRTVTIQQCGKNLLEAYKAIFILAPLFIQYSHCIVRFSNNQWKVFKAKLFLGGKFFVFIFTYIRSKMAMELVLNRLIPCLKCMELACLELQASLDLYYYLR